jgi:leader peptidase (prepilin peptidase)/N-methyltransferase
MEPIVRNTIFTCFLLAAAWQDFREKSIGLKLCFAFGIIGAFLIFTDIASLRTYLSGGAIGFLILVISHITDGAIGQGDGLFFIVSGLYTGFGMNLKLLLYGAFFNGIICLMIYLIGIMKGEDRRKTAIPFLPCLVPVWIGLVFL